MGGQMAEDGSPIDLQIKRGGVYKFNDPAVRFYSGVHVANAVNAYLSYKPNCVCLEAHQQCSCCMRQLFGWCT